MSRRFMVVMQDQGRDARKPVLVPVYCGKGRMRAPLTPCVGCGRPARGGRCCAPACREAR